MNPPRFMPITRPGACVRMGSVPPLGHRVTLPTGVVRTNEEIAAP